MKRVSLFVAFLVATSLVLSTLIFPVGAGHLAQTGGTGTPGADGTQTAGIPQTGNTGSAAFVNLQTLQGFQVQDPDGNAIGNVSDFVINLPKTRIDYIVMAGNSGRSVLVPWSSLSNVNAQNRVFTFKDPASRLYNAPAFDANSIDFTDPGWSQNTVNYWRFGTGGVNQNQAGQSQSGTVQPTAQQTQSGVGQSNGQSQSGTAQETGQAQNGTSGQAAGSTNLRTGAVATLASRLLNAQVVDIAGPPSGSNNRSNNQSNSQPGSNAQATPQGTSVPNTGSDQANSGEVLGTVVSAIVTRTNGDIRYILVRPEGSLAESIRQASLNNRNNQNGQDNAQNNTTGSNQAGTAQPTIQATNGADSGTDNNQLTTAQPTNIPNTGSNAQGSNGGEVIPVPFDIMFPHMQDDNLVLRASPTMLQSAPVVQSDIDNLGFGWDQNINLFWGSGGLQGGRFPLFGNNNPQQAGSGAGVPVTGSDQAALNSAAFVRLNTFNNFAIQDASGNALGNVQDFVVNLPKTRIDYIVMSATDGRSVLVPWAALSSVDTNQNVFFFRYPADQLQNAPAFDVNSPNFGDPEWDNNVINYWITGRLNNAANNNNNSNNPSGSNTGNNQSQQTATGTPSPDTSATSTPQGTTVPNTGSGNQGNQAGNQNNNSYAVLASQLVGLPVYDQSAVDASGNRIGTGSNANNNQSQGTAPATGAAQGTAVPNTGSGNQSGNGDDVIGTVQGAIVTRLNGNIRYLLVAPAGSIANTGGNNNQGNLQAVTPQATGVGQNSNGSSDQNNAQGTAQATGTSNSVDLNNAQTTAQPTGIPNTGNNNAQGNNGQGGNLIPVPFNAVLVSHSDNGLVLRASRFMLQNAPSLDTTNLPNTLGFGFDQEILNFWRTGSLSNNQGGAGTGTSGTPSP